jgi:hypothetical protein
MSITSITRNFVGDPNIVTIVSDDTLATITTAGYWTGASIAAEVEALQNGTFQWQDTDSVLIYYTEGIGFFTYDSTTAAFVANPAPAGTVSSDMVVASLLQHKQLDLTLAELIGSNTASVELIAAPGAGKKIILHRAALHINYGGTVLADGGTVQLQYADDADAGGTFATGTLAAATLIAATADTSFGFSPVDTTLTDATTLNEGLYLSTATADFTGGTGSTYKVDVWYSVADLV